MMENLFESMMMANMREKWIFFFPALVHIPPIISSRPTIVISTLSTFRVFEQHTSEIRRKKILCCLQFGPSKWQAQKAQWICESYSNDFELVGNFSKCWIFHARISPRTSRALTRFLDKFLILENVEIAIIKEWVVKSRQLLIALKNSRKDGKNPENFTRHNLPPPRKEEIALNLSSEHHNVKGN